MHIGCANADDAIYLKHALIRYVPHFIALAASARSTRAWTRRSIRRGCRRERVPAVGHDAARAYVERSSTATTTGCSSLGIVASMKDFYWDIRPKPEYGTVEIRVCDTPLTVERAAQIAAFAQALARWLFEARPIEVTPDLYLTHSHNRFQACRARLCRNADRRRTGTTRPSAKICARRCGDLARRTRRCSGSQEAFSGARLATDRARQPRAWLRKVVRRDADTHRTSCAAVRAVGG